MEVVRYGEMLERPSHNSISRVSMFAIGNKVDQNLVKVKLVDEQEKMQRYELNWPKQWDLTSALIGIIARGPQDFPMFDYVTEFMDQF